MKKSTVCLLTAFVVLTEAYASGGFKQQFKMNTSLYVPFDAATTVTLECPDSEGEKWVEAHFAQWFGKGAPKVVEGKTVLSLPEMPEGRQADRHI